MTALAQAVAYPLTVTGSSMVLEQPETQPTRTQSRWDGTVPRAFDLRVIAVVIVASGLAASVNVPTGGLSFALAAFVVLVGIGSVAHALGQRRLRRVTEATVDYWVEAGGTVESVDRTAAWGKTAWTIETGAGTVTVKGLALAPMSRLAVTWGPLSDSLSASAAENDLEAFADAWFREVFEDGATGRR